MITFNHHERSIAAGLIAIASVLLIGTNASAQTPSSSAMGPSSMPTVSQSFSFKPVPAGDTSTVVLSDAPYDAAKGYGFISVPKGNERAFSVKVPEGDYRVTVTLGDKSIDSRTSVWAEDRRLVADPVVRKAGETRTLSFIVNVRNAGLAVSEQDAVKAPHVGLRGDEAGGRTWDDQLTISVSGPSPALNAIRIEPVAVRRVLLAGDSTVTDQAGGDYASWGQMLPRFLSSDVAIANHARSGETMKSFLTSLRWDKLMSQTRPGDVVVIQFGHNDEKKQWPRTYAAADGAYPAFLSALVADVRQHGASPVLVTPPARRTFNAKGMIDNSHAGYDDAVRAVGKSLNVPVIDLTEKTGRMYQALGPAIAPMAFANGGKEKTHHNAYGAYMIADFVAHDLAGFGLGLKLVADAPAADPDHPIDPKTFVVTPSDWPLMRAPDVVTQTAEVVPLK